MNAVLRFSIWIKKKKRKILCTEETANSAASLFIFQSSFVVYKGQLVAVASCFCPNKNCGWCWYWLQALSIAAHRVWTREIPASSSQQSCFDCKVARFSPSVVKSSWQRCIQKVSVNRPAKDSSCKNKIRDIPSLSGSVLPGWHHQPSVRRVSANPKEKRRLFRSPPGPCSKQA